MNKFKPSIELLEQRAKVLNTTVISLRSRVNLYHWDWFQTLTESKMPTSRKQREKRGRFSAWDCFQVGNKEKTGRLPPYHLR